MAKRRKMSDATLVQLVEQRATDTHGITDGTLSAFRKKALEYYRGDKFGNEQDGRSQVVSRDTAEVIDGMMPSIMRVFSSGDEIVSFDPHGPEDEEEAKQATEYCNWVWTSQNPGFRIFYWWFKDALMFKQGVVKIWWDKTPRHTCEVYQGLTEAQAQLLVSDPEIEVTEQTEPYPDLSATAGPMIDPAGQPMQQPMLVDMTVTRTNKTGRIKIANVPLEEFLLSRRAVDIETAPLTGQRSKKSLSDLLEMGYDQKLLDKIPSDDVFDLDAEKLTRYDDEGGTSPETTGINDPSMRYVYVTEAYLKVDYDGDGIAELRRVCIAGHQLLDNEEVDDNPFAMCVPILMQHKAVGQSITDQTEDIQLIKSTLKRQFLDNLYLQSAPALAVDDHALVDIDEWLTRRVGQLCRTKGPPGNAFAPIPTQFVGAEVLQAIEYLDTEREQRTGVSRMNPAIDTAAYQKTATGVNAVQSKVEQRVELISRAFAETGVKTAFLKILKLSAENSVKAQVIKLRGKWVNVDPRAWKNGFDATVTVGLGTGNRDQQVAHLTNLLNVDQNIIKLQGGVQGPLVTAANVYQKLKKLIEAMGLKSTELYYTDPAQAAQQPQPPQQPHPEVQKAQIEAQAEAARQQADSQADLQAAQIKAQSDQQIAQMKVQSDQQIAAIQLAAETQLERFKAMLEAHTDMQQTAMQQMHEKVMAAMAHQNARQLQAEAPQPSAGA